MLILILKIVAWVVVALGAAVALALVFEPKRGFSEPEMYEQDER